MRPLLLAFALILVSGCGPVGRVSDPPARHPSISPAPTTPSATGAAPASPPTAAASAGTVPPPWLGTRPLPKAADGYGVVRSTPPTLRDRRWTLPDSLPQLPGTGFAARVETAPADVLARSTWRPGCPVPRNRLDWVRLAFWGFDDARHTGELLVNKAAADDLVTVFRRLYDARFPIEQMTITTRAELHASQKAPTGDGDNTGAFVCRPARGQTSGFSEHAYGLAIDVDPFQNPYVKGARVLPELASWYLDRGRDAPGVITPHGPVVAAFKAVGWGWGGAWHALRDYQHFSANGQ